MVFTLKHQIIERPIYVQKFTFQCALYDRQPKSCEILRFVRLQKDSKQCCDATKLNRTHCAGRSRPTSTMSTIELCGITALFGVFLETNKPQNLTRLRLPVVKSTLKGELLYINWSFYYLMFQCENHSILCVSA